MNLVPTMRMSDLVLDRSALEGLNAIGKDGGLVPKWIRTFLSDAPQKLGRIEEALATSDTSTVAQLAHTLKTNSGWLGGHCFYQQCERLELSARAGAADDCREQLPAVRQELPRLKDELVSYLMTMA